MITNEEPDVFLTFDLTQGSILACDSKFIDGWVVVFECPRLLASEVRMPRIVKELLVGGMGYPSDRFWQRTVLLPEGISPHRAESHL
jgi:hypothetical protein